MIQKKKDAYKIFIEQLADVLPCKSCGNNLRKNLDNLDQALENKESFLTWLINIRNEIYEENNESEKKKNLQTSINEIFAIKKCDNYSQYTYIIFLIIIVIFLIIVFINIGINDNN